MTVTEFIEGYKKATNKEGYIKERVVREYVPFLEKVTRCEAAVRSTSFIKVGDQEVFKQNSPIRFMLYMVTIIVAHTDIIVDKDRIHEEFDLLNGTDNLLGQILVCIPKHELDEFQMVMNMVRDDIYENERSMTGFFERITEGLGLAMQTVLNTIAEANDKQEAE